MDSAAPSSDVSTRLPLAGALAHEQGQHDAVGRKHGGEEIDDGAADEHRAAERASLRRGDAGHRLQHLVETGLARQRPLGPVPRNAAVDDPGLSLPQVVIADLQPLGGARTEILDHHVRLAHQAIHDVTPGGLLEIEPQPPLVAVDALELPAAVRHGRGKGARRVAAVGLDLDHVGAHVGQHDGAKRSGNVAREVENGNSFQRHRHRRFGLLGSLSPGGREPAPDLIRGLG